MISSSAQKTHFKILYKIVWILNNFQINVAIESCSSLYIVTISQSIKYIKLNDSYEINNRNRNQIFLRFPIECVYCMVFTRNISIFKSVNMHWHHLSAIRKYFTHNIGDIIENHESTSISRKKRAFNGNLFQCYYNKYEQNKIKFIWSRYRCDFYSSNFSW